MKNNSFDQYVFLIAAVTVGGLLLGSNQGVAQLINNSVNNVYDNSVNGSSENLNTVEQLYQEALTAINTYNTAPSAQNLLAATEQVLLLQPYNTITLQMIGDGTSTLDVYDAANRFLATALFQHANVAINNYNNTPSTQNLSVAAGQVGLLQPYNKITLAMIGDGASTVDVYDAANQYLASILFQHANAAINNYNNTPSTQNLSVAAGQVGLLQPYNKITLAMIGDGASTVDVYDAANQYLASILFQHANAAINNYNNTPSTQNLSVAAGQVGLLQPYNKITLAMIGDGASTVDVYDAANQYLASILFQHANAAINNYNNTPSTQNLSVAAGQVGLLQPYNKITLAMIGDGASTVDVYDAANQYLASILFQHANVAINNYNNTPSTQNLSVAAGQVGLLQPYNKITLAMIGDGASTVDVYDAANQYLASILFQHANAAINNYNNTPSTQNLSVAVGQVSLLQPYNAITLAMIGDGTSTLDVYDAANQFLASILFQHANNSINNYRTTPSTQNLSIATGQVVLLQPYNKITLAMIGDGNSAVGVYDSAHQNLGVTIYFIQALPAISRYQSLNSASNLLTARNMVLLLLNYNDVPAAVAFQGNVPLGNPGLYIYALESLPHTVITSCQQLQKINDLSGIYVLNQDIDCSTVYPFIPIGQSVNSPFTGVLTGIKNYGNGFYNINKVNVDQPGDAAFFGYLKGAQINDLGLTNVNIQGIGYVAGLAVQTLGQNLISRVSISGVLQTAGSQVQAVSISGVIAEITGTDDTLQDVSADVTLQGNSQLVLSGITGWNKGTISQSKANIIIKTSGGGAGFVGTNDGTITDSYATGIINGTKASYGFVGVNKEDGSIINSYASVIVHGAGGWTPQSSGFVGASYGTVSNSFWDSTINPFLNSPVGTAESTTAMKQQATFTSWDFTNTWRVQAGIDYPHLQWEPVQVSLNLNSVGSNGVVISSLPSGLQCPGTACTADFPAGQPVVLTATIGAKPVNVIKWGVSSCVANTSTCTIPDVDADIIVNIQAGGASNASTVQS